MPMPRSVRLPAAKTRTSEPALVAWSFSEDVLIGGGVVAARSFVTQMEHVMGTCLDRGIKVVSNAGGLDPDGCAEAVAAMSSRIEATRGA